MLSYPKINLYEWKRDPRHLPVIGENCALSGQAILKFRVKFLCLMLTT